MIKIYDDNRNLLISTNEYSNFSVLKEINQPDQFSIDTTKEIGDFIILEGYIETKEGTFVIKEKSFTNYYRIMGSQDLEDLDSFIEHKRFERKTLKEMIQGLVAPYGWTVVGDSPDKKTINIDNKSVIDGVFDCIDLFKYEIKFDNINKVIHIAKELGNDRGTYFHSDLNLKKTTISSDSYDFATRIIPVGYEGLTIESVNNGKKYLENHKYSNKIKTVYWKDERYHIPENLKATAEEMLENLAKPLYSLDCEIVNLVNNSKYSFLDFDVGDKVIIVDNNLKIKEKHRITSYLKYPNEPHRGVVTFENKPRDVIDRFTDINYRFDNYDNRFDDYDFKFDDFDMRFDDFNMRLDNFNLELEQIKLDIGEFGGMYSGLLDRLRVIEDMLGIGISCVVMRSEDITELDENKYIFQINNNYDGCLIVPDELEGSLYVSLLNFKRDVKVINHNESIYRVEFNFFTSEGNTTLDLSEFSTEYITDFVGMFSGNTHNVLDISLFNLENARDLSIMFAYSTISELIMPSGEMENVNIYGMFNNSNISEIDLSGLTINYTDPTTIYTLGEVFKESTAQTIHLPKLSFDSNSIINMVEMFKDCLNLTQLIHEPLSIQSAQAEMFMNTPNLTGSIDLSGGTIAQGYGGDDMFKNCGADLIYVKDQESLEALIDPQVNPDGIPVVIKES